MRIPGKLAAAIATMSLAAAPAIAATSSPASKLSLRASTKSSESENLAGAPIVAVLGLAAIVAGAVIIIADDDDSPDSP